MRKAILLGAVAASALIAGSAMADVTVRGTVDKDQTIVVRETLTKIKTVGIAVVITAAPVKAAKSSSHFNQENTGNIVCENCAEKTDLITNSILNNVGITSVNQSAGNNNNQGTVISFALDQFTGPPPPSDPNPPATSVGGFAESQVAGSQYIGGNAIVTYDIVFRDARLNNSIINNTGITTVNQGSGNVNNQSNAISVAISLAAGVSLSDSALGQFVTNNLGIENNVSKSAQALGSIQNNHGITQVNQSAGNFGNQSNVVSLSVTSPF